jgi:hypothetical protein
VQEGRWTTITPSQYQHEREALEHVRTALPGAEPYRAWSNFTFTANTGHVREIDLFVAAPSGLFLIEIKSLHGRLSASGANWVQTTGRNTRYFDNPLHLADSKAKQLKSIRRCSPTGRKAPACSCSRAGAGGSPRSTGSVAAASSKRRQAADVPDGSQVPFPKERPFSSCRPSGRCSWERTRPYG